MKNQRFLLLGATAAYLMLTLVMLWPFPLYLGRAVPGFRFDIWENVWSQWWVGRALWEGQGSLFFTDRLFHPNGASLLFHTLSLSSTVPLVPIAALWGPVAACGVYSILAFVLAGLGGYLLADEVLRQVTPLSPSSRFGGSFFAGVAFAFSSYHLAQLLAHIDLIGTGWIALYLWAMLRLWREGGWPWLLGTTVFFALACWVSWYFAVYTLIATGLYLLLQFRPLGKQSPRPWKQAGRTVAALLVALALLSPNLAAMVHEAVRHPVADPTAGYPWLYSADLLAYVTPAPGHPLWGSWTTPLYNRYSDGNWSEGVLYLGAVCLALAVWGGCRRWQGRAFWISCALSFAVLSFGPLLQVSGRTVSLGPFPIALPYAALHFLPVISWTRVPARFGLLVVLSVAVMAGVGAGHLLERISRRRWRFTLIAALALLHCAELAWIPYPFTLAQIPSWYGELAKRADDLAVLEVPIARYVDQHTERMLYQTVHGHPVFGGFIARGNPHIPYGQIPGFRAFWDLELRQEISELTVEDAREQALAALNHYGAGYIVLERTVLSIEQLDSAEKLVQTLIGPVDALYQDDDTIVYTVPQLQAPFWELGGSWGEWAWQQGPTRLLEGKAILRLILPQDASGQICLRLAPLAEGTILSLAVDGVEQARLELPPETVEVCGPLLLLAAGRHEVIPETEAACRLFAVWWDEGTEAPVRPKILAELVPIPRPGRGQFPPRTGRQESFSAGAVPRPAAGSSAGSASRPEGRR